MPAIDWRVSLLDSSGNPISVGGGTQYADGATQANPTGNVALWLDTSNVLRAASAAKPLPVNIVSGSGSGVSVVDAAGWTTASSVFVPGGGVFNDSAAALTSGQQGTQRLTAARGAHANLRTTAGGDPLLTHNNAAPAALANLGVLSALANAAVPSWTEGNQALLSVNLSGALRTSVEGPTASGGAITRPPIVVAGQASGNVKIWNLTAAGAGVIAGNLGNNTAAPASDFLENLGALANAAVPSWTEGNSVMLSVDLSGRLRTAGTLTNNGAAPAGNSIGVLPVIANAAAPSWTEGRQVLLSTDLAGNLRALAGLVAGTANAGNMGGITSIISATLTRPANTTTYTAGREMADTGNNIITLTNIATKSGGSGVIQQVTASCSSNGATKPQLELWLFDTTISLQASADNNSTAFPLTDGQADTHICVIPLTTTYVGDATAGTGNFIMDSGQINEAYLTSGSANLFMRIIVRNAYTPGANSETWKFKFHVQQDL